MPRAYEDLGLLFQFFAFVCSVGARQRRTKTTRDAILAGHGYVSLVGSIVSRYACSLPRRRQRGTCFHSQCVDLVWIKGDDAHTDRRPERSAHPAVGVHCTCCADPADNGGLPSRSARFREWLKTELSCSFGVSSTCFKVCLDCIIFFDRTNGNRRGQGGSSFVEGFFESSEFGQVSPVSWSPTKNLF